MGVSSLEVAYLLSAVVVAIGYFVFASFLFGAGYQPTPRASALAMLRLAELTPRDTLYDLGAGTGAVVFRAAGLYRATVLGVEVEPLRYLVLLVRRRLHPERGRISLRWGNLFGLSFRDASVVATFLWPGAMARLRPRFEAELRPGARVVSHCHPIPGWTPTVFDRETNVYLYQWPDATGPPRPSPATVGGA